MKHLLRQKISLYPNATVDEYGKKTWATASTYRARFTETSTNYINRQGEQQVADAICYLPDCVTEIGLDTRIDYDNKEYRVVELTKQPDGLGNILFYKVLLKEYAL